LKHNTCLYKLTLNYNTNPNPTNPNLTLILNLSPTDPKTEI